MAQTAVDHKAQWETVNRVVYPVKDTDLTLPLYAVNWHPSHFDANVFDERDSMMSVNLNAVSRSDFSNLVAHGNRPLADDPHGFTVDARTVITLEPNTHISLCTYFNAFPAGYWRHWTRVKQLRFLAEATGKAGKHCRTRPENQETTARHHQNHPAWILQLQARGVRQQDQGHHPHGLWLPPRRQPHRPRHAPLRRTRHTPTPTKNLTHENSRSL